MILGIIIFMVIVIVALIVCLVLYDIRDNDVYIIKKIKVNSHSISMYNININAYDYRRIGDEHIYVIYNIVHKLLPLEVYHKVDKSVAAKLASTFTIEISYAGMAFTSYKGAVSYIEAMASLRTLKNREKQDAIVAKVESKEKVVKKFNINDIILMKNIEDMHE